MISVLVAIVSLLALYSISCPCPFCLKFFVRKELCIKLDWEDELTKMTGQIYAGVLYSHG